jgi:hypothetical protein
LIQGNPGGLGNWSGEGMGREWGGGGQFTSNLGPGWTRITPQKKEGFQVSKRDLGERGVSKGNWQEKLARGINKGLRHDLALLIYGHVSYCCVNAANKRMCLGYK